LKEGCKFFQFSKGQDRVTAKIKYEFFLNTETKFTFRSSKEKNKDLRHKKSVLRREVLDFAD